jgi:hypothetical protein
MLERQVLAWINARSCRLYFRLSELLTKSKTVSQGESAMLCDDMESEHMAPLYYCAKRWLYRVFEFKDEIIFVGDNNNHDYANLCCNKYFIQKLA